MTFDLGVLSGYWQTLASGFASTVWLCIAGAAMAGALGILLTIGQRRGSPWIVSLIRAYTALTLGLPLLVLLYVMFFVLPDFGVLLPAPLVGTVTLAIYYGPYVAEVIHAAVAAVPAGTIEAGTAIGMSPARIARRIIAPQALPLLLPTMTGLLIGLIKDSALLSVISVHEFMFAAKGVVSDTYAPLEVYFVVAMVYWAATSIIYFLTRFWERRLGSALRVSLPR
ncbi:polar amino acid transport system permease protein [Paraburkholderia fungorum]|uniref:Polar amino acid transport system permease protein n=1 Tax=Paraburkholderia fungorum TaxID=134537 RepID=A0A1H1I5X1_9BURK|nr:ABC transporter permease subunit [Paraburkholderia fungorum]SDR33105.1 polar amino acid transport system permease protein [Paraburkholderia fungorum]